MAATALDTDLVTNVKKALKSEPAQPMFFAFVMKGGTDGKLIVSKAKIQPKQIDGAKKETGGSAVLRGVCFGDNGTLVFEMARPAAPNVAAVTKNVLKAKAGLALKVEYRVGRDDETIAESAEPDLPSDAAGAAVPAADGAAAAAAAKPSTVASDAEWKAKLAAWTPAIKAALVAKGPNAAAIGKLLAQATALSKPGGDMAQALAHLTECHDLATAGAAPAAPPEAASGDPAAEWKAKLAEWTPAIKAAWAAKGPTAGDIGKLLAQATALSKPGGDMVQALAKLTECHDLAKKSAGTREPGAPQNAEANWEKALAEIDSAYQDVLRNRPDDASKLRAVMGFAQGKAEKGEFQAALAALQKLREQLPKASAAAAVPTGKVAAAVLRSELQTLRMNAARGLEQLAATLKGKADPRAQQIEPIVRQLAVGMPTELEKVLEQLDAAVQSGDSATAQSHRAAIQEKAKTWMTFLQTNAHEIHCSENNPWGIAVAIDQPVRAALTAILKTTR